MIGVKLIRGGMKVNAEVRKFVLESGSNVRLCESCATGPLARSHGIRWDDDEGTLPDGAPCEMVTILCGTEWEDK